jgi:bacillithiol system protein YtxJ
MNWLILETENQLSEINQQSFDTAIKGIVIFKHSTRCSTSSVALNRIERSWNSSPDTPIYYLDLIKYRTVSDKIAELYTVPHQSPQILVIKNGKCIYSASHSGISVADIQAAISNINN